MFIGTAPHKNLQDGIHRDRGLWTWYQLNRCLGVILIWRDAIFHNLNNFRNKSIKNKISSSYHLEKISISGGGGGGF